MRTGLRAAPLCVSLTTASCQNKESHSCATRRFSPIRDEIVAHMDPTDDSPGHSQWPERAKNKRKQLPDLRKDGSASIV